MQPTATHDFSAWIDGAEIRMSKGDTFSGTKKAAEHLTALGLLQQGKGVAAKKPAAKEGAKDD